MFGPFVDDVIACVARECPLADGMLRGALAGRRVELLLEEERLTFGDGPATITVSTSARTLHDVLAGERDVLAAVLEDAVVVRGSAADLVAAADAATAFLAGVIRCVSAEDLWSRFVELVKRREDV